MEKCKTIAKKLLYPPVFVVILVSLSFPAIIFVLAGGYEASWFAYPLYVLSAYALTVVTVRLVPLLVRWNRRRREAAEAALTPEQRLHGLSRNLYKDLAVNLGYGLFYLASGYFRNSVWLMVNGVYNLVQGIAYGGLIPYQRTLEKQYDPMKAWRGYTAMGWWLMAVNLTMTGCVFLVIWRGETESYSGILVFAVAAMTFYKLVMSIISLVRLRRSSSPILGAVCNARHTEAIMSLFMLQTALLSAFGQGFPHVKLMNTLTGTGVCLLTIAGAAGMVLHGRKNRKRWSKKMENKDSFEYTYSAPERDEIRRIREKYQTKDEREEKMAKLRALDASVAEKATVSALVLGILSTLVLGVGMCCCLVWTAYFALGIPVGLLGMAGMALAYPVYKRTVEKERARVAPEILMLTEELM